MAFFAALWLIPLISFAIAYSTVGDDTLKSFPSPGNEFDINTGSILAPILRPRVSGTEGNVAVRQHLVDWIKKELPEWRIELQNSTSTTPLSQGKQVPFVNIIATRDPPNTRVGDVGRLALVAHYDSKLEPKGFIGAIDSAVPCAMILHAARSVDKALTNKWNAMADDLDALDEPKGVQILLLDGEEAFVTWTATDSLYGARALAEEWEFSYHPAASTYKTQLDSIDLFLLLDLLGAANPTIPSYFKTTHWAYKNMAGLEHRLRELGLFKSSPNHPSKLAKRDNKKRKEPHFLTEAEKKDDNFYGGFVEDDHIPFMKRGVDILHMIPTPFPHQWHEITDDGKHLHMDSVEDWTRLVTAFVAEWMDLEGHFDIKSRRDEYLDKTEFDLKVHNKRSYLSQSHNNPLESDIIATETVLQIQIRDILFCTEQNTEGYLIGMMPKGKPKTKFFNPYSKEDIADAQRRQMAPQSVPHGRGGKWQVPEHAKTGTDWDDMHYIDLKKATEEAGLYKKDMGKLEMIQLLAMKDRIDEYERRAAERELEKKRKEAAAWERRMKIEMIRKKLDRETRREADEDYVSDTTEEELEGFNDDSDESLSTSATTSTTQSTERVPPTQRLEIYEWPHGVLPSSKPPFPLVSPNCIRLRKVEPEPQPIKLPYAVMKLVTFYSDEKVELPGRQYPDEVGPDFVSLLSEHTKDCARNGVMYGRLKGVIIERGAEWAKRTLVQSWNGRMYFHLPPCGRSKKTLADVYAKWRKKDEMSRFKSKRIGTSKDKANHKAAERLKNKRQKMLDVFAVSEYRPPICFQPSYLDYPLIGNEVTDKSINHLFYIRFPNMDLPHYYFWATSGEWEDPTKPNPAWLETEADSEYNRPAQPQSSALTKILVKRTPVPSKFRPSAIVPKTSPYKAALCAFERDLYHKGWAKTLKECYKRWIEQGKTRLWTHLIKNLPTIYPAANLPSFPPINPSPCILSLAEKFAALEVFGDQHPVQPIMGDEPWTRDDAAYWRVVDIPADSKESLQDTFSHSIDTSNLHEVGVLERRTNDIDNWIQDVSLHAHSPTTPPLRFPSTPCTDQHEWENFLQSKSCIDDTFHNAVDYIPIARSAGISALCAVPGTKKRRNSEWIRELEAVVEESEGLVPPAKRKKLIIQPAPVKVERRVTHAENGKRRGPKSISSSRRHCLSAQQPFGLHPPSSSEKFFGGFTYDSPSSRDKVSSPAVSNQSTKKDTNAEGEATLFSFSPFESGKQTLYSLKSKSSDTVATAMATTARKPVYGSINPKTRKKQVPIDPSTKLESDELCVNNPSSASSSEFVLPKIPQERRRIQDTNFRYTPPSPSSGSVLPVFMAKKRIKHANVNPIYRVCLEPSSPSTVDERPLKKHKSTSTGRAKNFELQLIEIPHRFQGALVTASGLNDILPAAKIQDESESDTQSTSVASSEYSNLGGPELHQQPPTEIQWRPKPCCLLMRTSSVLSTTVDKLLSFGRAVSEETPSLFPNTQNNTVPKSIQTKLQTPKEAALAFKKETEATNLAARRHARKKKTNPSSFKPLIPTPLNSKNRNPSTASTTSSTNSLVDFLEPATPSTTPPSPSLGFNHSRCYPFANPAASSSLFDYSSDSEVSISLIQPVVQGLRNSAYINAGECDEKEARRRECAYMPVDWELRERKHSFDVEGSELRELVPPNTPV